MKKRAGIWTALLLAVVMLAGCGNPADQKDSKAKQKQKRFLSPLMMRQIKM